MLWKKPSRIWRSGNGSAEMLENAKEKLIYVRQVLMRFYAQYSTYVLLAAKWAVAFTALSYINQYFPGRTFLLRPLVYIAISLFCSILPWSYISLIAAGWLLAQMSALSLEGALVTFTVLLILALLRYLLLPGAGIVLVILPILFLWKIPFAVPLAVGLAGALSGFVSVGSGVILFYLMKMIVLNLPYLTDPSSTLVQRLLFLVKGLAGSSGMLAVLLCFCLTTLLVWFISRADVPYAHQIALVFGAVFDPGMLTATFNFLKQSPEPENLVWGSLASLAIVLVISVFYRFLDHAKTEKVQFEDDEYYYYVKAVPKVQVPPRRKEKELTAEEKEAEIESEQEIEDNA